MWALLSRAFVIRIVVITSIVKFPLTSQDTSGLLPAARHPDLEGSDPGEAVRVALRQRVDALRVVLTDLVEERELVRHHRDARKRLHGSGGRPVWLQYELAAK